MFVSRTIKPKGTRMKKSIIAFMGFFLAWMVCAMMFAPTLTHFQMAVGAMSFLISVVVAIAVVIMYDKMSK